MSEESYPANRLCLYRKLPCPQGCIQQLFWTPGEFQLELGLGGSPFCLDYVKFNMEGFSLDVGDYRLHGSSPFLFGAGAGILWHSGSVQPGRYWKLNANRRECQVEK